MSNLWIILKKELRELFRDKKSLAMMLVIPVLIPFLILMMSFLFESQSSTDITEYNKMGFAYELSDVEKELLEQMDILYVTGSEEEVIEAYDQDEVYLYVTKENTTYTVHTNSSEASMYAANFINSYFENYKRILQQNYLTQAGVNADEVLNIITVTEEATEEDFYFASYLKNYAFLFVIMAITVSATYPATDATAGEKERGTLETLLTFPIKSRDIILGKVFSVSLSSIITGVLSLLLAYITLILSKDVFSVYANAYLAYSVPALLLGLGIIVVYSFFISGICIAIASKSKTFKEAQSALTPLTFISFFPGMIAFMINVPTSNLLAFVPFLNMTMIFTDINNGIYNLTQIVILFVSSIVYIAIILYFIVKEYNGEKVLFAKV